MKGIKYFYIKTNMYFIHFKTNISHILHMTHTQTKHYIF